MPGNVENAIPVGVMPRGLSTAFSHSREYPVTQTEYHDGNYQIGQLAATSRKSWQITRRLSPDALNVLMAFYLNHQGPLIPFYFYDPPEAYDATGQSVIGRYIVRFNSGWKQTSHVGGRWTTTLDLIELA